MPRPVRLLTNPPRHLVAVHAGKTDVDDRHVRVHDVQQFDPADAIGRVVDHVPGELEHRPQPLSCLAAVLDQKHAPGLRTTFPRDRHTRRRFCRGNLPQPYREPAAVPFSIARRVHRAAVQLDQAPDEGQADSEAAPRAVNGLVGLHVHVEDEGQQRRRDAEARVLDAQHGVGAVGA